MTTYPRPPQYAHMSPEEWAKECEGRLEALDRLGKFIHPTTVRWAVAVIREQQKLIAAFEADAPAIVPLDLSDAVRPGDAPGEPVPGYRYTCGCCAMTFTRGGVEQVRLTCREHGAAMVLGDGPDPVAMMGDAVLGGES